MTRTRAVVSKKDRSLIQRNLSAMKQHACNTVKYKVIYLGRKNVCLTYRIGDCILESHDTEKDLGVMVDKQLMNGSAMLGLREHIGSP